MRRLAGAATLGLALGGAAASHPRIREGYAVTPDGADGASQGGECERSEVGMRGGMAPSLRSG
jgi:hypothetical protein